jgi:hypothetical protein
MITYQTRFFEKPNFILSIYILVAAVACLTKISIDLRMPDGADFISKVNNYIIYRNSFFHLIQGQNLYGYFPSEQYDEFLYSPTFALMIAPLAILPKYIGVVVWCMLNACCVFWAISKLPFDSNKKTFVYWFIIIELVTAIQNVQVNPIVCSLFIFAFTAFERKNNLLAALFIVLSIYIKVFGILGASLFLIYPNRIQFIGYAILWALVLFCLPMLVVSPEHLIGLYHNWFESLTADHVKNMEDVSVMRFVSGISGVELSSPARLSIQIGAVMLFCVKYLRTKAFTNQTYRYYFLAAAMIWSIIFNHAAESSTYIIAIAGVAIWYTQATKNRLNLALIVLAFILCSLSPTDIFPRVIRQDYVVPLALKALPCLLIYLVLEYNMLFKKDFVELKD